jgi:hypothetical protein
VSREIDNCGCVRFHWEENNKDYETLIFTVFPGHTITAARVRGYWVVEKSSQWFQDMFHQHWRGKYTVIFELDHAQKYCLQILDDPQYYESSFDSEIMVRDLLKSKDFGEAQPMGFPTPEIVAVDATRTRFEHPYLITKYLSGDKLLTKRRKKKTRNAIYGCLGSLYAHIQAVKGIQSGLIHSKNQPYATRFPISPNDFMFEAEICHGCGEKAVETGILTERNHKRIIEI